MLSSSTRMCSFASIDPSGRDSQIHTVLLEGFEIRGLRKPYPLYLWFVFALAERKNEPQKKMKYRCERSYLVHRVIPKKGVDQVRAGTSFVSTQNRPICLTTSTNLSKATGLTTYAFTPKLLLST